MIFLRQLNQKLIFYNKEKYMADIEISLISRLHDDLDHALEVNDNLTALIITDFITEIEKVYGKDPKDYECISILKLIMSQKNKASIDAYKAGDTEQFNIIQKQLKILKSYLPKPLNEDDFKKAMENMIGKSLGEMARLMEKIMIENWDIPDEKMTAERLQSFLEAKRSRWWWWVNELIKTGAIGKGDKVREWIDKNYPKELE